MGYAGVCLPEEDQKVYADGGESIKALGSQFFLMKNFAFRGPDEEILRLLAYVENKHGVKLTPTKISKNIFNPLEGFSVLLTNVGDQALLKEFPMLKAVGFVLEMNRSGNIKQAGVGYKESGFSCLTTYNRLAPYYMDIDAETYKVTSESYCWPFYKDPTKDFKVRYAEYNPAIAKCYDNSRNYKYFLYKFPFSRDWENEKYIFQQDEEFYLYDPSVEYSIQDNVLVSYKGASKTVGIPQMVHKIGAEAFKGNTGVTKVSLSKVSEIGASAFEGCSNLKNVVLRDGLEKIGEDAFANCGKLIELSIPDTVSEIGSDAFLRCGVNKVVWPKGITHIPSGMFRDCPQLYEIVIPPQVTEIGRRVFSRANVLIIHGKPGSVAEQFAKDNNMFFKPMEFK